MGQVTIYIDPETEKRLNAFVRTSGMSKSKWIAELIREKTDRQWPREVLDMAGTWKDFPTAEEIRAFQGKDAEREPF